MFRRALALLIAGFPFYVHAWGWEGHKLVCALAEEQLTREATEMVGRLLAEGSELKGGSLDFADACLWPDKVKHSTHRNSYENHFINVPDDATSIDLVRDCPAMDCIAVGVSRAISYLSSPASSKREVTRRAAALRFLGHYVADLHQPLHVGNASDRGGNRIRVVFRGRNTNLHALWDYGLLDAMDYGYPRSLSHLSGVRHTPDDTSFPAWMNESLALARSHVYIDTTGERLESGSTISEAYFVRSKAVIVARLTLAGFRLAELLNRIAAGESPATLHLIPVRPPPAD